MKHIKLFENQSVQSIRNMVKEYHKFFEYIKPAIIEKYNELANDPDYEPEYGGTPYIIHYDELVLTQIGYYDGGLQFVLQSSDDNGDIQGSFYINITDEELEQMLIKLDAKKYNL